MKLIVCGGRNYGDHEGEQETLWRMLELLNPAWLIVGGADGADDLAWRWWAKERRHCVLQEYWIDAGYGCRHERAPGLHRMNSAQYIQCGSWADGKHVGPYRYKRMTRVGPILCSLHQVATAQRARSPTRASAGSPC